MPTTSTEFVNAMVAMGTYRDKPICFTQITGGGHRLYGYRVVRFSAMSDILKRFQKNIKFSHDANGITTVEARCMTSHNTCTGVVDPSTLTGPPFNLVRSGKVIATGAVSKHVYAVNETVSDTLLHKLCTHPFVLDVWIVAGNIWVFQMHDRNIHKGLIQTMQNTNGPKLCGRRSKSTACKVTRRRVITKEREKDG